MFDKKSSVMIIAEIANTHEGNFNTLIKLIDECSKLHVNSIKFQIIRAQEILENSHEKFSLFQKLEFTNFEWKKIFEYSRSKKLKIYADVFGIKSAKLAEQLNVDGFKIHSSEINNPSLLKFLSNNKKPILLSTAGSYLYEIDEILKILLKVNKKITLMHGFQGYPTDISDLNLTKIKELKKRYNLDVGLMDHISGDSDLALLIPLLGVSLGVSIIEKHITLDRSLKGIDYYSSLNPSEFKTLIGLIYQTEKALSKNSSSISINEQKYRFEHKKNSISKTEIKKNYPLKINSFEFKRTNLKTDSLPFFEITGKKLRKDLKKSEILTSKLLERPKIAAIIACRVESERLFAKPLQNISNIPIIKHLLKQVEKSKLIDDVVLAISENEGNEIFVNFARRERIKFVTGDDNDVLERLIIGAKFVKADIVFRVTSENPFIYWEGIDHAIQKHLDGNYDFTFMDKIPIGSGFEIINLETLEKSHDLGSLKHRSELCSLYIHEHQQDFKINRLLAPKNLQFPDLRLTVDTPEDLLVSRLIYASVGNYGKPIPLIKIINFLKKHPEIININSSIPLGVTRIWK